MSRSNKLLAYTPQLISLICSSLSFYKKLKTGNEHIVGVPLQITDWLKDQICPTYLSF